MRKVEGSKPGWRTLSLYFRRVQFVTGEELKTMAALTADER